MLEVWLPLLVCMALIAAWYHVLRLRERAIAHARHLCERHGLQLLDDSVGLHRLRAQWQRGGLHVTREYRFETSRGGDDRQAASITLRDNRVVGSQLPAGDATGSTPAAGTPTITPLPVTHGDATTGNVIPFERARRTLH
jgi:hypothetical protein